MTKSIVAIGDSLTYGFPFSPAYSWVNLAGREIGVKILNKGVCGESTEDMMLRFFQDALILRPDYTVMTGGTNDAFLDISPEEVGENVLAMITMAGHSGISPLVGLPPPVNFPDAEALLRQYREKILAITAANKVQCLDFYGALVDPATGGLRREVHNDGVHPNETGYRMMAAEAVKVLRDLGV